MQMPEAEGGATIPTLIFGSVNGVIGIIASLPQAQFELLQKLQNALTSVIKGIGGFSHSDWRSFINERKCCEARNFLDGDLIECFLDLRRDKMQEVAAIMDMSVDDLTRRVEDMQRLH